LGAKDIDREEMVFLDKMGVRYITPYEIARQGIHAVMKEAIEIVSTDTDAVYVSFDMDVLDCTIAPGTGIKTRGGLDYREVSYITHVIGDELSAACLDIIEVNPLLDVRNQTAELSVEILMGLLGVKYTTYEKNYLGLSRTLE
ncbi:MAG: arginase family protein, partial [Deltaproteobacteria bacterium]|nr:arginase family protein [Deltaproteobacteria bacterium]